jgi:two-component system sensor histidine kinase UhpB
MSLRSRLMLSIIIVMAATIALSGVVVIWNGRRQVHTELAAALAVANVSIQDNYAFSDDENLQRVNLISLVSTFDGARNVEATLLTADHRVLVASTTLKPGYPAPKWFVLLLSPALHPINIPVAAGKNFHGQITLRPIAVNEASEVWANLSDDVLFSLWFFVFSVIVIYRTAGWLVAPVKFLSTGISDLRQGRKGGHIEANGPRELRELIDAFNCLVSELFASEQQTRALEDQLVKLQEEERAELSRNLHDEVGPLLFLAKIDLVSISRHPEIQENGKLTHSITSVAETLSAIQMHLRDILGRLRPYQGLESGLPRALDVLLAHWRERFTEIRFELCIQGDATLIEDDIQETAYRIIQEALSNALRHSQPTTVKVAVIVGQHTVDVSVTNNGKAIKSPEVPGIGIRNMHERAETVGGTLSVNCDEAMPGWVVRAILPLVETCNASLVTVK